MCLSNPDPLHGPSELEGQSQASISVIVNGQASAPQTFNLVPFAPGIFSMNAQGTGQGAILDSWIPQTDPKRVPWSRFTAPASVP